MSASPRQTQAGGGGIGLRQVGHEMLAGNVPFGPEQEVLKLLLEPSTMYHLFAHWYVATSPSRMTVEVVGLRPEVAGGNGGGRSVQFPGFRHSIGVAGMSVKFVPLQVK